MANKLELPLSVVSRADVGRVLRELSAVEATAQRQAASKESKQLPSSPLLNACVEQNKLDIVQTADREALQAFLKAVHQTAPVMHFSFSSDPSPRFLGSLLTWLRREIHPTVLLRIGLEPALGAGCVLRTTNRYFDFSLRHHFDEQRDLLVGTLKEWAA